MLTLQEIDAKIQESVGWMEMSPPESNEYKKEKKNLEFYRMCRLYILTNPLEEYLVAQVQLLEGRLDSIEKNYPNWITTKTFEKDKQKLDFYYTEMGVPDIKRKLTAIKFLL